MLSVNELVGWFTARADTADGQFEIVGTGTGSFHIGAVSLMPADNISGFKSRHDPVSQGAGNRDRAVARRELRLGLRLADGIGDRDRRPPRRELAWNGMESNDMGIDDFMTFCRLVGAAPYLAVNSGLGDAHSAA